MQNRIATVALITIGCASTLSGCTDDNHPSGIATSAARVVAPAPGGLQTVTAGAESLTLWPYTGTNLAGAASDPINVIFRGKADVRSIRAALMALDGNRTALGFPNVFPFNCTWTDAFGDVQTAYAAPEGWTGSVVQLQCGTYGPIRFHIRLFPQGEWTIANAHFELLIPGTADHQVLSWELAEKLVVADFARSGLLAAAPASLAGLNPAPGYRSIPAVIYNGMPAALKQMIGGPAQTSTDIPIGTDGSATLLTIGTEVTPVADTQTDVTELNYNQVIPRPFCSTGPLDYVLVQGPISLAKTVTQTAGGNLTSMLRAEGQLTVTPINPLTGVRGETGNAQILDVHQLGYGDHHLVVESEVSREEIRPNGSTASLKIRLHFGGNDQYSRDESCPTS